MDLKDILKLIHRSKFNSPWFVSGVVFLCYAAAYPSIQSSLTPIERYYAILPFGLTAIVFAIFNGLLFGSEW